MAFFVKVYDENPNISVINKVVEVLKKGGLIIYPTDTVYGLGCDITNAKAVKKIARIKGIKVDKSNFSFICNDLSHLSDYVKQIDSPTYKLLRRALPGPYTFILPGSKSLPKVFKKKKTVGIRIPNNNIVRAIVEALGNPIISTSIRDEDDVIEYTTDPELIFEKWKHLVDGVIDGGFGGNLASTIIDLTDSLPKIIREGKGATDIL